MDAKEHLPPYRVEVLDLKTHEWRLVSAHSDHSTAIHVREQLARRNTLGKVYRVQKAG
jgi:hypothetical protein